jgi:hypothetical protein
VLRAGLNPSVQMDRSATTATTPATVPGTTTAAETHAPFPGDADGSLHPDEPASRPAQRGRGRRSQASTSPSDAARTKCGDNSMQDLADGSWRVAALADTSLLLSGEHALSAKP